jgi:hypothetical protein
MFVCVSGGCDCVGVLCVRMYMYMSGGDSMENSRGVCYLAVGKLEESNPGAADARVCVHTVFAGYPSLEGK